MQCVNPDILAPDQLSQLVKMLPEIEAWINAVKDRAMEQAMQDNLPGFKVVNGRSLRKWTDDDKAAAKLFEAGLDLDELYEQKFVSVATAERMLGKPAFRKVEQELVYRTEGKPVLAPLSDKRAAINPAAEFKPVK